MGKGKARVISKTRRNRVVNQEKECELLVTETEALKGAEELSEGFYVFLDQKRLARLAEILRFEADFHEETAWRIFQHEQY